MTDHLNGLLAEIRRCRLCEKHLPLGPRPVVRAAAPARVLIVGQAPGRAVHRSGIPFDDPSGDRLRAWLGVSREAFYDEQRFAIIPMGFCFPGTGSSGDLPPRVECAPAWREPLLALLPNVELTLVIGRYAIDWHLPELKRSSVTKVVAGWQSYWPRLLPLPHPSPRNNRWLRQNPWLEDEVIPTLQAKIATLIGTGD